MGFLSVGDAVVLGLDLSWSRQDLLAINLDQVSDDGHVKHRRIKTGVAGNPPLLALGRQRASKAIARAPGSTPRSASCAASCSR